MRVLANAEIPASAMAAFKNELEGVIGVDDTSDRVMQLSLDPPAWINLVERTELWHAAFGAVAAVYVAELVKEAAKATWKVAALTVSAAAGAATKLAKLGAGSLALKLSLGERSEVHISIPQTNEYFSARLNLSTDSPEVLQAELALFVTHLPAVVALAGQHKTDNSPPATGYFLSINEDLSLSIVWFDGKSLERNELQIPLALHEV